MTQQPHFEKQKYEKPKYLTAALVVLQPGYRELWRTFTLISCFWTNPSAVRSWLTRKHIQRLHAAATVIKRAWQEWRVSTDPRSQGGPWWTQAGVLAPPLQSGRPRVLMNEVDTTPPTLQDGYDTVEWHKQLWEYAKNHGTVHFKSMNLMVFQLDLNKAIIFFLD